MPSRSEDLLIAVTGSQHPYIFDLPQLLSLPDGFEFRFRYRLQWVAADLRRELEELRWYSWIRKSEKVLAGRSLVLVFHSQEQRRLVPIRLCTVIAIELLGPMVFVRFRVGPIVRVSKAVVAPPLEVDAQVAESARLNERATSMLDLPGYNLSNTLPEGFYLRRSAAALEDGDWKTPPGQFPDEIATWASLAALLQTEPHLYRVPFFRLVGFQQKNGRYRDPEDIKRAFTVSTGSTKGFKLVEGERYRLRLLEWCETNKGTVPGAIVTATVPQDLLFLEGASNLIVGKYDVLEFACMAKSPGYGELAIRVEPPGDKTQLGSPLDRWNTISASGGGATGDPWPYFYAARVPIHVRHNRLRVTLLGIIGLLGIVLYVWGPAVPLPIGGLKIPREIGQLAGLAIMFTALGEYLQRFVKFSSGLKDLPLGGGLKATK